MTNNTDINEYNNTKSSHNPKEYTLFKPSFIDPHTLGHELTNNKYLDPTVIQFLKLSPEEIAQTYIKTHLETSYDEVMNLLTTPVNHMRWSGSDLLNVQDEYGIRKKVVLETNSCPSGALDFPTRVYDITGKTTYEKILRATLIPQIKEQGDLAVIWDKNRRGTRAYAKTLASLTDRNVHWISLLDSEDYRIEDQEKLKIKGKDIAGGFRYVTQRPWERISVDMSTPLINPIIGCLAGGRNKLLAGTAYNLFNKENTGTLKINTPYTTQDLDRSEILDLIASWNFIGVIKDPYSNAGQGVYTITNEQELEEFANITQDNQRFILQQLIGNEHVTSNGSIRKLRHVGSAPIKGNNYAIDVRMMVVNSENGYSPVALYGRRARAPLDSLVGENISSWDILGTNLSVKLGKDKWRYDEEDRQIVATPEEFPKLGIVLEDLVDIYIQASLSNLAINNIADKLMANGKFNRKLFSEINKDPTITNSII
ncbi:MAG: hypothetical protein Q8Q35_04240 [Nanoarchaeota archaeon]|nr:hypothetical protein [Nanoarchaeota archaeon]